MLASIKNRISKKNIEIKSQHLVRLVCTYLIVFIAVIAIVITCTISILSGQFRNEAQQSNDRMLSQLTGVLDHYVLGNLPMISSSLINEMKTNSNIMQYMDSRDGLQSSSLVDALAIQHYLNRLLYLNPTLDSISIYFGPSQTLVSSKYIRYPGNDHLTMGELSNLYGEASIFSGKQHWFFTPDYPMVEGYDNPTQYKPVIEYAEKLSGSSYAPKATDSVLYLTFDALKLSQILRQNMGEATDQIIIADSDGRIITHSDQTQIGGMLTDAWYTDALLSDGDANSGVISLDGADTIVSSLRSAATGWTIFSLVATDKTTELYRAVFNIAFYSILVISAIALFFTLMGTLSVYRPLRKLTSMCNAIPLNNGKKRSTGFEVIGNTINNLNTQIKEQQVLNLRSMTLLKQEYIRALFRMDSNQMLTPVAQWAEFIGKPLRYNAFIAAIILCDTKHATDLAPEDYAQTLEESLDSTGALCYASHTDKHAYLLINYNSHTSFHSDIQEEINSCLLGAQSSIRYFSSGNCRDSACPVSAVQAAASAEKYYFLFPERHAIEYPDIAVNENAKKILDRSLQADIATAIRRADHSACITMVDELASMLRESAAPYESVRLYLNQTTNLILDCINSSSVPTDTESIQTPLSSIEDSANIFEYKKSLITVLNNYFTELQYSQNRRRLLLVKKAQKYIEENIHDSQLSLYTMAKHLGVSTSHLSRVFKGESGLSFSDYLSDYRLNFCREMLLNTDTKIETISNMMYSTPQYFANRFKRKYGCSPKEYRMRHQHPD